MRDNKGFTLIELLIVVVIIGILAAIAIPKYSSMKEKSFIATVTSDLKHLASMQETYHGDSLAYATDVTALTNLTVSQGVVITINEADGTGWAATAYHTALPSRPCGIFYGDASAANADPATQPGYVTCTPP